MGRPHTWCNTLGTSDFMRVPIPAARITTASGGRLPVGLSVICLTCREWWSRVPPARPEVAGAGGFEPPDAGTKPGALPLGYAPAPDGRGAAGHHAARRKAAGYCITPSADGAARPAADR